MVSPSESCEAPRSNSRLPTSTTCSTGTAPSHGSPKHMRDVGADVEAGVARPAHGRLEHRELLVEAAVEVALRERLGGAAEDRDVPQRPSPAPGRGRARWAPAPAGRGRRRRGPPRARRPGRPRPRAAGPTAGARSWWPPRPGARRRAAGARTRPSSRSARAPARSAARRAARPRRSSRARAGVGSRHHLRQRRSLRRASVAVHDEERGAERDLVAGRGADRR